MRTFLFLALAVLANISSYGADILPGAMERLPHPYSLILDLILIEGMDYAGIARMTGQKEATLRSWYSRGRAKLIKELKTQTI